MDELHYSFDGAKLEYDAWRELLRAVCGRYEPKCIDLNAFLGWARPVSVYGFSALDLGCNAEKIERVHRDVRLDDTGHCYAVFQITGRSAMVQHDREVPLIAGDVALVDAARPVTYHSNGEVAQWLSIHLPRQSLISHLGIEPQATACMRRGTIAARLLLDLIQDASATDPKTASSINSYMQLAFYDLLGALFVPDVQRPQLRHTDKLFARIRDIIHDRFADPDFGPCEVATEVGVSLRYLQKLFTDRESMCSELIYAVRLDQAAKLVHRRQTLRTGQPLTEIAYACGFRDYTHFARKFHRRFGCSPGAYAVNGSPSNDEAPHTTPADAAAPTRLFDARSQPRSR